MSSWAPTFGLPSSTQPPPRHQAGSTPARPARVLSSLPPGAGRTPRRRIRSGAPADNPVWVDHRHPRLYPATLRACTAHASSPRHATHRSGEAGLGTCAAAAQCGDGSATWVRGGSGGSTLCCLHAMRTGIFPSDLLPLVQLARSPHIDESMWAPTAPIAIAPTEAELRPVVKRRAINPGLSPVQCRNR